MREVKYRIEETQYKLTLPDTVVLSLDKIAERQSKKTGNKVYRQNVIDQILVQHFLHNDLETAEEKYE